MTKVVLFNPSWHTKGGGEKYLLTLADVLAAAGRYDVGLLAEGPSPSVDEFRTYFDLPLPGITMEHCRPAEVRGRLGLADIAIIESNFRGFGHPATRTAYVLQTPYGPITLWTMTGKILHGAVREAIKDLHRLALVRDARAADLVLANSHFSAGSLQRAHGIFAEVLFPPIQAFQGGMTKHPMILSVGRFFGRAYNAKRYDVLVNAFKEICRQQPAGAAWEYHIAGSCVDDGGRQMVRMLEQAAKGFPVRVHANVPFAQLQELYGSASIFWHGAGYGVDELAHPEQTEHFGMSTAEAMAAGCVPVVCARGGQREIVSHGESGYLWNTVAELVSHTLSVIADPDRRKAMAGQARQRATDFSRDRFGKRVITLMNTLEHTHHD